MLFADPRWFFWANQVGAILNRAIYGGEELARKASRLRIPGNHGAGLVVEYVLDPRAGGQAVVQLVPEAVGGEAEGLVLLCPGGEDTPSLLDGAATVTA